MIQNVDNRYWCFHQCPIGTLQDGETYTWQIDARDASGNWIGSTMTAFRFTLDFNLDSDGDGVIDLSDNCPDDWNEDQTDGDGDGIGDGDAEKRTHPIERPTWT